MNYSVKSRAVLLTVAFSFALSGCGSPGPASAGLSTTHSLTSVEVTDSNGMRPGVFPTTRVEPPTGVDQQDGPPPTPDSELTADDLLGLITAPASAQPSTDSCAPADVNLALTGIDAAAGHRYARLIATNISDRQCSLIGWPGLGLRGESGTPFPTLAERNTVPVNRVGVPEADADTPVELAAGGSAAAELEWTGALAGAYDEPVSLIAVQLTIGATPAVLLVDPADHVDLGPESTVRIGPWGSAG